MKKQEKVTVIGLGQMGRTLASLLLKNGYHVTVWNRTSSKAETLIEEGAILAPDVVTAVKASPVIVVCVLDYPASLAIFNETGVADSLQGRSVVQLTTGDPKEAIESEKWMSEHGAEYIVGAIQVAPEQMAQPDTTIFFSGTEAVYRRLEPTLKIFGGNLKYLGNKISAASAMDLASLSYLYGSLLGFFHAARLCEVEGFDVSLLGEIVKEVNPGFASFIQYESGLIQEGKFDISQSPLAISVDATQRIYNASKEYNINSEVPKLMADFLKRAKDKGLEGKELASLIQVFRG
ncbi:NAD(P)-binding domain-containing protein [Fulvivirga ulvae]|uniref:NAD(P)-dependent oxidoreductase n=1 Tax=Fulvivirga ulvae TaxID=2904245 RepID=UPI001F3240A0|nr:NAD(P)-binding domain-containing protein [Fulvivirga ulvae]UII29890.1 NAD(P)-binding domain-containing protein [Fulvivirga ulvae]